MINDVCQYPIPEGFLEAEERDGYFVSAKMKRVWAVELDIFKRFVEICEQYGLTYWLIYGSLIGAVRHKGFIPWDNDFDVCMPRKSFDKLLEIGEEAFQSPLFFQTPISEKNCGFVDFAKIRNSSTTFATTNDCFRDRNGGVFIDIFCLDEMPKGWFLRKLHYMRLKMIYFMGDIVNHRKSPIPKWRFKKPRRFFLTFICRFVYRKIYHNPDAAELFRMYNSEASRYIGKGGSFFSGCSVDGVLFKWNQSDWLKSEILDFEGLKVSVPQGYDNILKVVYGDYMEIPDDKNTSSYHHIDPDMPYKEYYDSIRNQLKTEKGQC